MLVQLPELLAIRNDGIWDELFICETSYLSPIPVIPAKAGIPS